MKQPDFFRLFAEKMQSTTPPPDFSGNDWQALQGRLDAHDRKRDRILPLGWLYGLTAVLLLSNLGWYLLWQKTGTDMAALRTEFAQKTSEMVVLHDTIYKQLVVYQYDTIYQTVVLKRADQLVLTPSAASQQAGSAPFFDQKTTNASTSKAIQQHQNTMAEQGSNTTETGTDGVQNLPGIPTESPSTAFTPELLPGLALQPFNFEPHRPILPPVDDQMTPTKQEATAFALIPQSFALGLEAGGLTPIAKGLASSSGAMYAFSGEVGFSDHLSMVVVGSIGRLKFKGYVEDPTLGLPALQPPSDDYELKYFETHDGFKPVTQLGLGMRWHLMPNSKLNPWLGTGWTSQWNPSYELEVEYTHLPTGMEVSNDLDVPAATAPLSYLGFNLGLRYRLMEKWHLQTGFNYDFKLGNQPGIERWWSWKGGVMYRF